MKKAFPLLVAVLVGGVAGCVVNVPESPKAQKQSRKEPNQAKADDTAAASSTAAIDRITLTNYYRVKDGMTYKEVQAILGPASEEVASGGEMVMLTWKRLLGANAVITFQNGRVIGKAQMGLPAGESTPDYIDEATAEQNRIDEQRRAERIRAAEEQQEAKKERQAALEAEKWRTWTDVTGGYSVEAEFHGLANGVVSLKKKNGKIVKLPLEKLSEEDRKWIKQRSKK